MARVVVSAAAVDDLASLIRTHTLPPDTRDRVRRSLAPLADFPLIGAPLSGRWNGFRFLLGPWRWMIVVYAYEAERDEVAVVTIQDGRSAGAPSHSRAP